MIKKTAVPRTQRHSLLALLFILLVGACLRAPFTSLGPLWMRIQHALHVPSAAIGIANAIPLIAFALISPLSPLAARKFGLMRVLGGSLLLILLGIVLRSWGDLLCLYAGTCVLCIGIAMGNVLVPSLIKRDFPYAIAKITGGYVVSMCLAAGIGSAVIVPLMDTLSLRWQQAAGVLLLLPTLALSALILQKRTRPQLHPVSSSQQHSHKKDFKVWHSPLAWQVTFFFLFTSLIFYIYVSWLPAMLTVAGISPEQAGIIHGVIFLFGSMPGLVLLPIIKKAKDQRGAALSMGLLVGVGALGLAWSPSAALIWSACIGFGTGSTLVLGLMFVGLRTNSSEQAAKLSGMAQAIGYFVAACGPVCAGFAHDLTHSWQGINYACAFFALHLGLAGWGAGRNLTIEQVTLTRSKKAPSSTKDIC